MKWIAGVWGSVKAAPGKGSDVGQLPLAGGEVEDLEGGAEFLRLTVERPFSAAGAARVRAEVGRGRAGFRAEAEGLEPRGCVRGKGS